MAYTNAWPSQVYSDYATQVFGNHGTTSGWDDSYIDAGCGGTVQQFTNVVKEGGTALKMTHTHNPSYNGLYHCRGARLQRLHQGPDSLLRLLVPSLRNMGVHG